MNPADAASRLRRRRWRCLEFAADSDGGEGRDRRRGGGAAAVEVGAVVGVGMLLWLRGPEPASVGAP